MAYPSPCDTCKEANCKGVHCDRWRIRYLYRQKQINGYAKKIGAWRGSQAATQNADKEGVEQ